MKSLNTFLFPFLLLFSACRPHTESSNTATHRDTLLAGAVIEKPSLLLMLPANLNAGKGLALDPNGRILLSAFRSDQPEQTNFLYRLSGDSLMPFVALALSSDHQPIFPTGLAFGPDGHLYLNDCPEEGGKPTLKSRLLRARMADGKAMAVEVVVEGLHMANSLCWKGNDLYVSGSLWDETLETAQSAVFHFQQEELDSGKTVLLQPGFGDPHILDTFSTPAGSSGGYNSIVGLDYDSKGVLYAGMAGNGAVYKIFLKPDGSLDHKELFVAPGMLSSVDGFAIDRRTDKIYLSDSRKNAIRILEPSGQITMLWENGESNGRDGSLNHPATLLLQGNELIIANFDRPLAPGRIQSKSGRPVTLTRIRLP